MAAGQTQIYTRRAQVFVTEETTDQDTYKVQAAAEGFLAEISDSPLEIGGENYTPASARGDGLSRDEVPGIKPATISFRVPLAGSGAAGTAPDFADALLACGYRESLLAATSAIYYPYFVFDSAADAGPPATRNPGTSYSVTVLEDGVAYRIKGAFGNVVFVGNVGEPIFAEFTMTGAYAPVVDDVLETVTYQATSAPTFMGASFSMNFGGAVTPKGVTNFTVDTGNQIATPSDVNETYGVYGSRITGRRSFGAFDPEMVLVATANSNFYGIQAAGTTGTLTTGVLGGTAGNRVTLALGRIVTRPIRQLNRDSIRGLEIGFSVSSANTDVEGTNLDITLTFT
jgi:hypothetical protein